VGGPNSVVVTVTNDRQPMGFELSFLSLDWFEPVEWRVTGGIGSAGSTTVNFNWFGFL